jgi:hypothetical protein
MTETIQKTDKTGQNQDQTLFDDLERRYGPAMAQEIIDQLKKAENLKKSVSSPVEYMAVKALSEATEIYRQDAKVALKHLKTCRRNKTAPSKNIVEFDDAFLQKEFDRSFSFYLRFHHAFHVQYRQAMAAYKVKAYVPSNATITSMAA